MGLEKLTTSSKFKVRCPKCGSEMEYIIEKERLGNGELKIRTYYRCPVCGTIVGDQVLSVERIDGHIKVLVEESRRVIIRKRSTKKISVIKKLKELGLIK